MSLGRNRLAVDPLTEVFAEMALPALGLLTLSAAMFLTHNKLLVRVDGLPRGSSFQPPPAIKLEDRKRIALGIHEHNGAMGYQVSIH